MKPSQKRGRCEMADKQTRLEFKLHCGWTLIATRLPDEYVWQCNIYDNKAIAERMVHTVRIYLGTHDSHSELIDVINEMRKHTPTDHAAQNREDGTE
jgi:hypothetical protein